MPWQRTYHEPFPLWILLPRQVVICTPDGFRAIGHGRGRSGAAGPHRWSEVTAIAYEEVESRSLLGTRQRMSFFSVEAASGPVLRVSHRISDFEDLIAVFNAMTPHLPYIWEKTPGRDLSLALQAPSNRTAVYRRAARSEAR